jgi:hypothetical protein
MSSRTAHCPRLYYYYGDHMRLTVILCLFIATTFAVPIRAFAQAAVDSDHWKEAKKAALLPMAGVYLSYHESILT